MANGDIKNGSLDIPPAFECDNADVLLTKYGLTLVIDMDLRRFEVIDENEKVHTWISFDRLSEFTKKERALIIEDLCQRAIRKIETH